jgi:hypothetical protein
MSNLQKYLAGLNPRDPNSRLSFTGIADASGVNTLNFLSVSGIVYRLEYNADLTTTNWQTTADNILGNGAVLQITDTINTNPPSIFYRIRVKP